MIPYPPTPRSGGLSLTPKPPIGGFKKVDIWDKILKYNFDELNILKIELLTWISSPPTGGFRG